jgi:hypothetical protein
MILSRTCNNAGNLALVVPCQSHSQRLLPSRYGEYTRFVFSLALCLPSELVGTMCTVLGVSDLCLCHPFYCNMQDRLSRVQDPKSEKAPKFHVKRRFTIGVPTILCNNRSATSDLGQDQTV